jgi:PAS domain S-box-containing protein
MGKKDEYLENGDNEAIKNLFNSSELYQILFENASEAIFFARDLKIIDCNIAALSLFGFNIKSEMTGRFLFDFSPVQSADGIHLKEKFQELIATATSETTTRFDWKYIKSDKTFFEAEITMNSFRHENQIFQQFTIRDITSLRNKEKALTQTELKYKRIFENVQDVFYQTDLNGIITEISPSIKRYSKYIHTDIIGQPIENFYANPASRELLIQEIQEKGEALDFEVLLKAQDNLKVWSSVNAHFTYDDAGKVTGVEGTIRELTERKQAEEALSAKEAHLNTLLQSIPDLIWVKDINGTYLTCNKMFESFFGATAKEIVGKTDYDFVDRELADFFRKNDKNAIEVGKPFSNEEWVTFASNGNRVLLETIKAPMYDSKGITIGVLGIGRDITDRKRSEERLRQSENQYRTLIQSMPDGVYRSTPEGKFIEVNDAMVRILGYDSKEDLMSIDIKSQLYFDSEERESLTKKMRLNELDVFPLRKKDGTIVYIEDHGWLVTDENDNIIFHEGVSRDVTQRKIAEVQLQEYSEQLKELVATKDKFFSIIAHDLKSPFNSILGLSEIIKNDARYLDIATIEQYAGIIYSTSNNTFRLLENLLDWARIQQSQMPFQPASLILKTIANEVIELSIEKANSKIIAIINYIPDNLIVMADRNMLNTILRNLISNALKFTSANGKVGIKAISKGNTTEISVEDTGTGIKQEDISKIFEIGSSFSKRGTENEKGTGLGLLLCKEFVEKHGGHIWVESEEGKGSTFFFTINNSESLTK